MKPVIIVGTGPAALMAATELSSEGVKVQMFDAMRHPARKFLVAGYGGLNLTNAEVLEKFILNYTDEKVRSAVLHFTPDDFRDFLRKELGIETYVGSAGKVFPLRNIKPAEVLKRWVEMLRTNGVEFLMGYRLVDIQSDEVLFQRSDGSPYSAKWDKLILALGGASWKKTGSDGKWADLFNSKGMKLVPFGSSNAGFVCDRWDFAAEFGGSPLKNIEMFTSKGFRKKGELTLTQYGMEGILVYAANKCYRNGELIYLDLKPDFSRERIRDLLARSGKIADGLTELKLGKPAISWLRTITTREQFIDPVYLSGLIKTLPVPVVGLREMDESISTVGGVPMSEVSDQFELSSLPGVYAIGEMLDWDAPTGGYLIQGAAATGVMAARSIIERRVLAD